MSRRASLLAKQEKRKPRVRFPDELVFLDNIKDNDIQACHSMLRRASVQLDLNGLDTTGLTPLHNAVLEGNLGAVELLVQHGADINRQDADTWTPLHAACANGEADIARFLLSRGASKDIKTADNERPLDLCDARDFGIISVMLESDTARRARMLSAPDEDDEKDEDDDSDHSDKDNDEDQEEKKNSGDDMAGTDGVKRPGDKSISTKQNNHSSQQSNAHPRTGVKTNDTSSLTKGMNKLKTVSDGNTSSNQGTRNPVASQSSPKTVHKASPASPSSSRAKQVSGGTSPSRKSPTSTPKLNKSPSRSSPGTPRKSPARSPGIPRKSPVDHAGSAATNPQTISLGRTGRSNNSSGGSAQSQLNVTKTPKPPGHSILKKNNTHHCHAVAE